MAKQDDSPTPTNVGMAPFESLAGVNLNYPASINKNVNGMGLTPMSQYILNSYGQFNLPTALTNANYMAPSAPVTSSQLTSLLPSASTLTSMMSGSTPQLAMS